MKNNIYTILLVLFVSMAATFVACEKDEIETIPLQTVNGEITEAVDYGLKVFSFDFKTDLETYPITYLIRSEVNNNGNHFTIKLLDIQKDGLDDLNVKKGSASCKIDLGALPEGDYTFDVSAGQYSGSGTFKIEENLVTTNLPETEGISISHDTLNRIPFGTIWGYVGYQNVIHASIANGFISNLNALGAQNADLNPGYYGYFSVSDSGDIIQPIDPGYTYYKEYFKSYSGSAAAMEEHVSYYTTEFYSKIDVIFYWFWDGEE